jgi:hypothetical protein
VRFARLATQQQKTDPDDKPSQPKTYLKCKDAKHKKNDADREVFG